MQGYAVAMTTVRIGLVDYRLRVLADRCQYWDPEGRAARAGISAAAWPLFGMLWPAGIALAEEMSSAPIAGLRILEVGCGLGLASLVLRRRGADITCCDHHPLAREFLRHNAMLNGLEEIEFHEAPWGALSPALGRFDLIIGADLLYERDHPELLAGFVARHARRHARMILSDPGRAHRAHFRRRMRGHGYASRERRVARSGCMLHFDPA